MWHILALECFAIRVLWQIIIFLRFLSLPKLVWSVNPNLLSRFGWLSHQLFNNLSIHYFSISFPKSYLVHINFLRETWFKESITENDIIVYLKPIYNGVGRSKSLCFDILLLWLEIKFWKQSNINWIVWYVLKHRFFILTPNSYGRCIENEILFTKSWRTKWRAIYLRKLCWEKPLILFIQRVLLLW